MLSEQFLVRRIAAPKGFTVFTPLLLCQDNRANNLQGAPK